MLGNLFIQLIIIQANTSSAKLTVFKINLLASYTCISMRNIIIIKIYKMHENNTSNISNSLILVLWKDEINWQLFKYL